MAVVTRNAAQITARDTQPKALIYPYTNAQTKSALATIESVSGDSIASVYKLCSVPSNCYIRDVIISSDDMGTTTIADFGCYYGSGASAGTVIDADFFGSAVSLKDGALSRSNITHEAGTYDISNMETALWSALGLTSDPKCMIDICATLTAACDGAGTLTLEVRYV